MKKILVAFLVVGISASTVLAQDSVSLAPAFVGDCAAEAGKAAVIKEFNYQLSSAHASVFENNYIAIRKKIAASLIDKVKSKGKFEIYKTYIVNYTDIEDFTKWTMSEYTVKVSKISVESDIRCDIIAVKAKLNSDNSNP